MQRFTSPLRAVATRADNLRVMIPNRSLVQGPTAHEDHPFSKARRHHRLMMQELVVRASVAIIILLFAEILTVSLGFAVSSIIRLEIGRAHV